MSTSVRKRTGLQQGVDASVSVVTSPSIEEEIARRAYEIYLERGKVDGYHLQDWLQAENELKA